MTRTTVAAGLAALAMGAPLLAQDGADALQPVPGGVATGTAAAPSIEALVADLGSSDVTKRLAAFELARSGRYPLRQLEQALRGKDLSPEQRRRLMSAARARFEAEPRAAMGIQFDMASPDSRGALISEARAGFHAREVLKPRDRVVKADGMVIDRRDALRRIIVAHDAGDEVPLVVERDGATLDITVRLGDFPRLSQPMDFTVLVQAWELRSRPYAAGPEPAAGPIESGLTGAAWAPVEETEEDAELSGQLPAQRARMLDPASERTGVVAGGEARHGLGADLRHVRTADHAARGGAVIAPVIQAAPNVDLPTLRIMRDQLAEQARLLGRRGNRRSNQNELERLRMQIMVYNAEIERRTTQRPGVPQQPGPGR